MADRILGLDGQKFDPNGVKVTMPFTGQMVLSFLMEAQNEGQVRLAMSRGVSINAGLVASMVDFQLAATTAPPEVVEAFLQMKRGTKS